MIREGWESLPAAAQDALILLFLAAPFLAAGLASLSAGRPWALAWALLSRHRWSNLLFVLLIAVSVALGVAVSAAERALRQGAAQAARPFDVLVAAPGDELRVMLASVFLEPGDLPLLDGETLARLAADPDVAEATPLAFGDNWRGAPVVGLTAPFVERLGGLEEGRVFAAAQEAVLGAEVPLALGARFTPAHGHPDAVDSAPHEGFALRAVGRLATTGSPWDRAILVPIEAVWQAHGLADGHPPGQGDRIGPPFEPPHTPGAPVVVLTPKALWGAYRLVSRYSDDRTMAFLPGATLARLAALLGDLRGAFSTLAALSQIMVAAGVAAGLAALMRLFARRFALLRALGAPRRFVLAVVWQYAAALSLAAIMLGLALGMAAAALLGAAIARETGVALTPTLGWRELQLVAALLSINALLALAPAIAAYRRPPAEDLRAG